MAFKNFSIWHGRLPHWRAEDVRYYVTFRHRRELTSTECQVLLASILREQLRALEIEICCVLPEQTEMIFTETDRIKKDLSVYIEKAKARAGKKIIAKSGERFPPFYTESFDRIIRDGAEYEETWLRILESPVTAEFVEDPGDYAPLFVAERPD